MYEISQLLWFTSYCINVFVYFRCMESVKYLPMFTLKSNYKATPVQFVKVDQSITETLLYFCQLHCKNRKLFAASQSQKAVRLSPTSVFLSKALRHVGTTLHFFPTNQQDGEKILCSKKLKNFRRERRFERRRLFRI